MNKLDLLSLALPRQVQVSPLVLDEQSLTPVGGELGGESSPLWGLGVGSPFDSQRVKLLSAKKVRPWSLSATSLL